MAASRRCRLPWIAAFGQKRTVVVCPWLGGWVISMTNILSAALVSAGLAVVALITAPLVHQQKSMCE